MRGESASRLPFAEKPVTEYSFARQNWFPNLAAEHRAARETVAVFDQTGFSKFIFKGRDVVKVLQRLCGNNVDVPIGRTVYTGMFNQRGGFESDLTLVRLAADEYYLVSGAAQTWRDLDWIRRNIRHDDHAEVADITAAFGVLGLMGPNARRLLERVTDADLSNQAFPFGAAREIGVGQATVRAVRITYVGELGWELHVPMEQLAPVYDTLMAAGRDLRVTNAGHYAINSLRLEKGHRAWGAELSPDDRSDAEAFRVLAEERTHGRLHGLAIAVHGAVETPPEVVEAADLLLPSPREAAAVLNALARAASVRLTA